MSKASNNAAITNYLEAWKHKDWPLMAAQLQQTAFEHGWNAERLKDTYGNINLLSYAVVSDKRVSDSCHHILVSVDIQVGAKVSKRTILANVICEEAPYKPSPTGRWGVNPVSTMRMEV